MIGENQSGLDARDLDRRKGLAVGRALAVILAAAEFLDNDLLILELANDRCRNGGTAQRRLANLCIAFCGNQQNLFERKFRVGLAFAKVNNQLIAHSHSILVAAIFKNRVHQLILSAGSVVSTCRRRHLQVLKLAGNAESSRRPATWKSGWFGTQPDTANTLFRTC